LLFSITIIWHTSAQPPRLFCPLQDPTCWCIPEGNDPCPDRGLRESDYEYFKDARLITFLKSLKLQNPSQFNQFSPSGCNPYPAVAEAIGAKVCNLPQRDANDAVCVFSITNRACRDRTYKLQTMAESSVAQVRRAVLTHEGPCGACSSASDLARWFNFSLDAVAYQCGAGPYVAGLKGKTYLQNVTACFEAAGFSPACAFVWASNAYNSQLANCAPICREYAESVIPQPPNVPLDCWLHPCLQCDEDASGEIFAAFAGRTRRRSGILTYLRPPRNPIPGIQVLPFGLKRNCTDTANISQNVSICPR
jgi:hypothetical protein